MSETPVPGEGGQPREAPSPDAVDPELPPPPAVRVLKGEPTPDELAALVASLLAAQASLNAATDDGGSSSLWNSPATRWGLPPQPSRTAWRWSSHRNW